MNALSRAASPYLRQHQDNPVEWVEWNDAAFARAKNENKLVVVSVGYAACHWCHVMAHESFEDAEIAAVMNRHYICIKVDREERPDVDQIYLEAVQLMTGRGGWPLNCFLLPDGRPVYGGTYFRPEQWKDVLERLTEVWQREPEAVALQAEQITAHLRKSDSQGKGAEIRREAPGEIRAISWPQAYESFSMRFDKVRGGRGSAPKFPMPCEWQFLLRYGMYAKDSKCLEQVTLTLDKMAAGGIYDHLAGGFARYSTDSEWKVPHFEKMLYDNAQLLELYAEAGAALREPRYLETALGIAEFLEAELAADGGGYCSALDADSEGEEGRYYVWTSAELKTVLKDRFAWFADFCGVDGEGLWEEDRNILLRHFSLDDLAEKQGWTRKRAEENWESARRDLSAVRARRLRPMLDDKVLTSWNGLLLKAFAAAYRHTGEEGLRQKAARLADFLLQHAARPGGGLWHRGWHGDFAIEGFLEDYAFLAEGLIELYQCTFSEPYLEAARKVADYALAHFSDPDSPLLFFTADNAPQVLVRKKETQDNVIPSSNAAFARMLLLLGEYYLEPRYRDRAESMLSVVRREFPSYAPVYAAWSDILFLEERPAVTFAVVGPDAENFLRAMTGSYSPHLRLAGSSGESSLPLLRDKHRAGVTLAFRCQHGTCDLPEENWKKVFDAESVQRNPSPS